MGSKRLEFISGRDTYEDEYLHMCHDHKSSAFNNIGM